jgi:hypothetical protein
VACCEDWLAAPLPPPEAAITRDGGTRLAPIARKSAIANLLSIALSITLRALGIAGPAQLDPWGI